MVRLNAFESTFETFAAVTCSPLRVGEANSHPRVFLEIAHQGHASCPYCGTEYRLKAGEVLKGGH